jgi:hypothetical protein
MGPALLSGAAWLSSAALVGCGSTGTGSSFVSPTYLRIDPSELTVAVPCEDQADAGDGLRSYAVVLERAHMFQSKPTTYDPVVVSPPTSCRQAVRFEVRIDSDVPYEAFYAAEVIGFAEPASDVPVDSKAKPSELAQTLRAAGAWVGSCSKGEVDVAAGDGGLVEFTPGIPMAGKDGGFEDAYWGPQQPVDGRTVTLRGCALAPAH